MIDKQKMLQRIAEAMNCIYVPGGCVMNGPQAEVKDILNGLYWTIEQWDGREGMRISFPSEIEKKIIEKWRIKK